MGFCIKDFSTIHFVAFKFAFLFFDKSKQVASKVIGQHQHISLLVYFSYNRVKSLSDKPT